MKALFQDFGNSKTLKDQVYLNLRELIITGKLQPGSRLPEDALSKQMNISRAPIREALNMLEREGFAIIIPRKGAVVADVTPELVKDLWEMRYVLETYAARASVDLVPQEEICRITEMVHRVMEHSGDMDLYIKCDLELHEMFHKYKNNRYLTDYITSTASHALRLRYFAEYIENYGSVAVKEVCEDHLAIMDAFNRRDPDLVFATVAQHVENSQRRCKMALSINNR